MGRPRKSEQEAVGDPRTLILNSARTEIEQHGILGLRVADVANNANYAVSVIYRYFGSRDGLLAQVLGDMYEEMLQRITDRTASLIPAEGPLTVDQILAAAPRPSDARADSSDLRVRLQILAVAATNPVLEERIKEIAQRRFETLATVLQLLKHRLPEGQVFDERVFTIMIVNQLLYYNTLLGPYAASDEEYYEFLKSKATAV